VNQLQTVELFPGVSMSDVVRRFRESPGTMILRAYAPRPPRPKKLVAEFDSGRRMVMKEKPKDTAWRIQFIGPRPDLTGLAPAAA
jgi:hypothetical protein